uniref:Tub domain-containing protein n=1 Tax=Haemonchus contortus TaxID=6289 RepID=A0A7I4Z565_HAECO
PFQKKHGSLRWSHSSKVIQPGIMAQTPAIGASYPSRKRRGNMLEWEQENDEMSKPSSSVERTNDDSKQYSSGNEKLNRKTKTALTAMTNRNGSSEPTLKSKIRRFFKVPPYYLTIRSSEVHKLCTFVRAPGNIGN